MNPVTQRAIAAVGEGAPPGWGLAPDTYASVLGPEAAPLKRLLLEPEFAEIVASYAKADRAAGRSQKTYKRFARTAAWSGFGAAVMGSLVLMSALLFKGTLAVLTPALVVQGLLLVVSLGSSLLMGIFKPFETWMAQRAEAETARIGLFDRVMHAERNGGQQQIPLMPLQLEYLRRYLLDDQRVYYAKRSEQHAAVARTAWRWRLVAFGLVLLGAAFPLIWAIQGTSFAPLVVQDAAEWFPDKTVELQRLFLGLGIIAAALQGLLASFAVVSLDERNAVRYRNTADNLKVLSGVPLEQARAAAVEVADGAGAAAAAARDRVLAFVGMLEEQISTEHREWVALRKVAPNLALDRLNRLRPPARA